MPPTVPPPPAPARALELLQGGLIEVVLPSGIEIRGKLPTVADLYVRDLVPAELAGAVARFALGANTDDLPPEDRALWFRWVRLLVAAFILEVRAPGGDWLPASLSIDDTLAMASDDVDELEYIVLRQKTGRQVTAEWRARRGEIPESEALAIIEAESAETIAGWATFRNVLTWLTAGAGGPDLGPAAEQPARPNRAARRARPRRSSGAPAGP